MKINAQIENARMLAATLGIDETGAASLLDVAIAVTFDATDETSVNFVGHFHRMISRTVSIVALNPTDLEKEYAVELVIGAAKPKFSVPIVYAAICVEKVIIGPAPISSEGSHIHPLGLLLAACYAVGAVLKKAVKDLPFPSTAVIEISLRDFVGDDLKYLYEPIQFEEAYLAGAGAIGNGFLYGLSQLRVEGTMHIVDDDSVSDGNLQRCVFFEQKDIDLSKAEILCRAVQSATPAVTLKPHKMRLQDMPAAKGGGRWLRRLIVGVDSPRARRSLQLEIPGEVYDASTTGIAEVVIHFNRQPAEFACLSCLYHESPEEHAHERHVAENLGVSIEEVRKNRISPEAAKTICVRYNDIHPSDIIGLAFDTLFKQLCSSGSLITAEGRQVLTPFAFVSVLAGVLLAMEFARRVRAGGEQLFNEWHISPWTNPVFRLRRTSAKNPDCEFCGNATLAKVAKQIWSQ